MEERKHRLHKTIQIVEVFAFSRLRPCCIGTSDGTLIGFGGMLLCQDRTQGHVWDDKRDQNNFPSLVLM